MSDAERRSRFSFAVARSLEIDDAVLQRLMYVTSTAERLRLLEAVLLEGRGYLAARSTLRDTLS